MRHYKNAIALLVTVFFIILISASVSIGLKYINETSNSIESERFLIQTRMYIEDILDMLQNSPNIENIADKDSIDEFYSFLMQNNILPIVEGDTKIIIKFSSARSKFNPNSIKKRKGKLNKKMVDGLKEFCILNNLNSAFIDIMLDVISSTKSNRVYRSDIFVQKPKLLRGYISTKEHFDEIVDFYKKNYLDNSIDSINFDELFYISRNPECTIDLNYASVEVWQLLLGVDKIRAKELYDGIKPYKDIKHIGLHDDELKRLKRFKTSVFEPYIYVDIDIVQNGHRAKIGFEYDLKNKKGTNFIYDV